MYESIREKLDTWQEVAGEIWKNPELAYQEYFACKKQLDTLDFTLLFFPLTVADRDLFSFFVGRFQISCQFHMDHVRFTVTHNNTVDNPAHFGQNPVNNRISQFKSTFINQWQQIKFLSRSNAVIVDFQPVTQTNAPLKIREHFLQCFQ